MNQIVFFKNTNTTLNKRFEFKVRILNAIGNVLTHLLRLENVRSLKIANFRIWRSNPRGETWNPVFMLKIFHLNTNIKLQEISNIRGKHVSLLLTCLGNLILASAPLGFDVKNIWKCTKEKFNMNVKRAQSRHPELFWTSKK